MTYIVLLPGLDGTGLLFKDFLSALGGDYEPIVISYPQNHVANYDVLIEFVRSSLPLDKPFFLLAESFSGPVAIALAASKPKKLAGLMLCASFDRNPIPIFGPLSFVLNFLPINSRFLGLIAPLLFGKFSSRRLISEVRSTLEVVSPSALRFRLQMVLQADFSRKTKEIEVPILYIQASEDRIVRPSALRKIVQSNSKVEVIEVSGPHLLLQVQPIKTAEIVATFVKSNSI